MKHSPNGPAICNQFTVLLRYIYSCSLLVRTCAQGFLVDANVLPWMSTLLASNVVKDEDGSLVHRPGRITEPTAVKLSPWLRGQELKEANKQAHYSLNFTVVYAYVIGNNQTSAGPIDSHYIRTPDRYV